MSATRRRAIAFGPTALLWVAGLVLLAVRVAQARGAGQDIAVVLKAARAWTMGADPFADERFIYLPSAALIFAPTRWLPEATLSLQVLAAACLVLTCWLGARLTMPQQAAAAPIMLVALTMWEPLVIGLRDANVDLFQAPLFVVFLLAATRSRWLLAGAVLGLMMAVKPEVAALYFVLLLARQRLAMGVAVAVPVLLSAAALVPLSARGTFFTETLPYLAAAQEGFVLGVASTIDDAVTRAGLEYLSRPLSVLAVILTTAVAWALWRRGASLIDVCTVLLAGSFAASTVSFAHYCVFFVPALFLVAQGRWVLLAAASPLVALGTWPGGQSQGIRGLVSILGLGTVVAVYSWRSTSSAEGRTEAQAASDQRPRLAPDHTASESPTRPTDESREEGRVGPDVSLVRPRG